MVKRWQFFLLTVILLLGILFSNIKIIEERQRVLEEVSDSVLRLHIRANSDDVLDQQLKLKVKDALLKEMSLFQEDITDVHSAACVIQENQAQLMACINKTIRQTGVDTEARMIIDNVWFPQKSYGDVTLPEGRYNAVVVEIGSGQGHNWWCVLFPQLCFIDPVNGYVPEESKEILKQELSENTYDEIVNDEIIVKFRIIEWLKKISK